MALPVRVRQRSNQSLFGRRTDSARRSSVRVDRVEPGEGTAEGYSKGHDAQKSGHRRVGNRDGRGRQIAARNGVRPLFATRCGETDRSTKGCYRGRLLGFEIRGRILDEQGGLSGRDLRRHA